MLKWLTGWIGRRRAKLLNDLGSERRQAGDLAAAAEAYRGAVAAAPDHPASLYNLGVTLRELKRAPEAERHLRKLVSVAPEDADGLFQLGELLYDDGRLAEAAGVLERAFQASPRNALVAFYTGIAHARSGNPAAAAAMLGRAIGLEADFPDAQLNLGNALGRLGRQEDALLHFQEACRLRPDNPVYAGALLNALQHACDWKDFDERVARQRRALREQPEAPIPPAYLLSLPSSREEQLQCARNYAAHVATVDKSKPLPQRPARPDARIRIGYLSSSPHAMAGLHDRTRFEILAYPLADVARRSVGQAAAAIRADAVDILVDLEGYALDARPELMALRPAPVQVSHGYAGTMGADFIDYLVADSFLVPPAHEPAYSEQLVLLPCHGRLDGRQRTEPPADAFVFCAPHPPYAILPETFASWMRLLKAVPGSVLWLLEGNALATQNLRREAAAAGVAPDRLVFVPDLSRLAAADLCLDAFPCSSARDALEAGVPTVTRAGDTFASRTGGGLLRAAGLPELVTDSLESYERLALRLATSPDELRALRERLGAAPRDASRFVRSLESAYLRMWDLHQAGKPPERIEIP